MSEGVFSGFAQGVEVAQNYDLGQLALQQGQQKVQQTQMEIDHTRKVLEVQKSIIEKMGSMSQSTGQPGDQPGDPGGVAASLATKAYAAGDAYMKAGLFEEGMDVMTKGAALQQNATKIAIEQNNEKIKYADMTASLMEHVHDESSFRSAIMTFQTLTGQKSPYAQTPYTPQLKQQIMDMATSVKDKATMEKEKAQGREADALAGLHRAQADKTRHDLQMDEDLDTQLAKAAGAAGPEERAKKGKPGMGANQGNQEGQEPLSVVIQTVAGALKKAGVQVQGGFSGKAIGPNTKPFIMATPRQQGEPLQAYAERVAQEAVSGIATGHAQIAEKTAEARVEGRREGAIAPAISTMMGSGPVGPGGYAPDGAVGQFVEAAKAIDYSNWKPFQLTKEGWLAMSGDPRRDAYAIKANALAMDYAATSPRGSEGAQADREHALKMMGGAKSVQQAETIGISLMQEAGSSKRGTRQAINETLGKQSSKEPSRGFGRAVPRKSNVSQ